MGIVPEVDLQPSFDRAFADHDSSFPVNAYDLKSAYTRIVTEQREKQQEDHKRFIREQELRHRLHERPECSHCFNSGFREIDDPNGGPNRGVVRCDRCEYWHRRSQT